MASARRRTSRVLLAALPVFGIALVRPAAAAGCAAGFQDAGANVCTATLAYSGAPVALTLPAGVNAITVTASGAEGGTSLEEQVDPFGGAASPGGKGGRETAVVPTAFGATITVVVGQAGTSGALAPPGFGGYGGGGHASSRYGGNGGGGSFAFDPTGVLVAAGGGGGGGYDYNPVVRGSGNQQAPGGAGAGAEPASDGLSVAFCCDTTTPPPPHFPAGGGGGATPTAGGAGGHPALPPGYSFGQVDGDPGSGPAIDENNFGTGGSTHNGCCSYVGWAGGGGGGYFGGGGGGNIEADLEGGGGGGGAGYVSPAAFASSSLVGVQVGDGEVVVSYFAGACHPSCSACSGPTSAECTACPAGDTLVGQTCMAGGSTTTSSTSTTVTTTTVNATTSSTTTTTTSSTSTTLLTCGTVTQPTLVITRVTPPAGDDGLTFTGKITLTPPVAPMLAPMANGVTVRLADGATRVLDTHVLNGAFDRVSKIGWKVNKALTKWTYVGPKSGAAGGIVTVVLTDKSKTTPGLVLFRIVGRAGSYAAGTHVTATLVLSGGAACFDAAFAATHPAHPSCVLAKTTLRCK